MTRKLKAQIWRVFSKQTTHRETFIQQMEYLNPLFITFYQMIIFEYL